LFCWGLEKSQFFGVENKLKRKRKPPRKPPRRRIVALASRGLNRDEIAATTGLTVAKLRSDYPLELSEGRKRAADAAEAETAPTKSQYWFLHAVHKSFAERSWLGPDGRNLLFRGMDGKGAKDILDAYSFWASNGEVWNTSGIGGRFNKELVEEFLKIISDYRK
jgi:hypothetical protein